MSLPVASLSVGPKSNSRISKLLFAALFLFAVPAASRAEPVPDCMGNDGVIPVDNKQVLDWKSSTQNQFQGRANVLGPVTRLFDERNGHLHFEISIGKDPRDVLEVVYNVEFGTMPRPNPGMMVQACGDYITSIAQSGPYPPSPSGAIIHWVHFNPRGSGHPDGFVVLENSLYGYPTGGVAGGRPRSGRGRNGEEPYFYPAPFGEFPSDAARAIFFE